MWVPVSLFVSLGVVIALALYFRFRSRSEVQQTLRQAIERGQEMTPEFLERLGDPPRSAEADLRRGLVSVGLGAAFAIFGLVLGEEDAVGPFLGLSAFPFCVGAAYLFMWKWSSGRQ